MKVEFTRPGTVTDELLRQRPWSLPNLRKVSFHNDDSWRAFTATIDDRTVGALFFELPDLYPHRIEVDTLLVLPDVDVRRVTAGLLRALAAFAQGHRVTEIACIGVAEDDEMLAEFGFTQESVVVSCSLKQLSLPGDAPNAEAPRAVEAPTPPQEQKVTSRCGTWSGHRKYLSRHEAWCKSGCKPAEKRA